MERAKRSGAVPWCLAALLALTVASGARGQGVCRSNEIGQSQLLVDERGRPVTMESPSAVETKEGVAFFARRAAMWESERVFFDTTGLVERVRNGSYILPDSIAGFLLRADGKAVPIRRPALMSNIEQIVAVSDNHGGAWVTWIAQDSTEKRTLWAASYSAGRWSKPAVIFAPRSLNPESLSITADETGKPYVSVGGTDGETTSYVSGAAVLARQRDDRWSIKWIRTNTLSAAATQIITGRGSVRAVMAGSYATGFGAERADNSGVFSAQSTDGGESWSAWKVISSSGEKGPNWPQLIKSSEDTLHLFWMEMQKYRTGDYFLRNARSVDGGVTWVVSDPYKSSPLKAAAAFVLRGVQYYVAEDLENQLALVELRNNEAPVVNTLPWHETSMPPRAVTMGDHIKRTLVTFADAVSGAYPNAPQYPGRRMRYAWITPCRQEQAP